MHGQQNIKNIAEKLSLKNLPTCTGLQFQLLTSVENGSVKKGQIFKRIWLLSF